MFVYWYHGDWEELDPEHVELAKSRGFEVRELDNRCPSPISSADQAWFKAPEQPEWLDEEYRLEMIRHEAEHGCIVFERYLSAFLPPPKEEAA